MSSRRVVRDVRPYWKHPKWRGNRDCRFRRCRRRVFITSYRNCENTVTWSRRRFRFAQITFPFLFIPGVGCHTGQRLPLVGSIGAATHTIRGVLIEQGNEPATSYILRTTDANIVLDSVPLAMLNLSQLELSVQGRRTVNGHFRAASFLVRGANGTAAWDGS